jgi:hypothetical protein
MFLSNKTSSVFGSLTIFVELMSFSKIILYKCLIIKPIRAGRPRLKTLQVFPFHKNCQRTVFLN